MSSLNDLFGVKGLTVVVTGGGTGLGLHMARAFAANGAKVIITGRRAEVLQKAAQDIEGSVIAVPVDVTSPDAAKKIIEALGENPKLDVLINNAGIGRPDPPSTFELPVEKLQEAMLGSLHTTWSDTFHTNVEPIYFLSAGLLHLLAASPTGGRIINISSMGGQLADPRTYIPAYQASKAAVNHLTRVLASKLRNHGVRVNAIAPGYFESEMNDPKDPTSLISKNVQFVPLKRAGNATDIAGTAVWLASPAGSYVDGQVITLDGGRSLAS
ncbi:NAD(P)-binding protein [Cylindrobasidium torrendii FP15055 ss-10]|uniref:NAD(P)-binding protein n=1 Tax=Cylindrobasidium torrendii FP15055 ss-10 TaxID=1314674 RepID=A0A0D7BD74_9AGAR|nr:NAD(P)-binding protein [Cylindrobasidium torrendii FP15055 ss-10]